MRLNTQCDAIVDYLYQDGTHSSLRKLREDKYISGLSNETHRPTGMFSPQGNAPRVVLVTGGAVWCDWKSPHLLLTRAYPVEPFPADSRDLAIPRPRALEISGTCLLARLDCRRLQTPRTSMAWDRHCYHIFMVASAVLLFGNIEWHSRDLPGNTGSLQSPASQDRDSISCPSPSFLTNTPVPGSWDPVSTPWLDFSSSWRRLTGKKVC